MQTVRRSRFLNHVPTPFPLAGTAQAVHSAETEWRLGLSQWKARRVAGSHGGFKLADPACRSVLSRQFLALHDVDSGHGLVTVANQKRAISVALRRTRPCSETPKKQRQPSMFSGLPCRVAEACGNQTELALLVPVTHSREIVPSSVSRSHNHHISILKMQSNPS